MQESTYGDFDYIPDALIPEAHLELCVSPIDLTMHWQRCGLLSDMVAGFIAYAYPEGMRGHQSAIYSSISTIFQELIENAARYSRKREAVIKVRIRHYNRVLRIEVENDATTAIGQSFEKYVKVLLETPDLESMYVQVMENQAAGEWQSGIGLILLLKDYPIRLGVRFERTFPERDTIIVRAYYHMETVDHGADLPMS